MIIGLGRGVTRRCHLFIHIRNLSGPVCCRVTDQFVIVWLTSRFAQMAHRHHSSRGARRRNESRGEHAEGTPGCEHTESVRWYENQKDVRWCEHRTSGVVNAIYKKCNTIMIHIV